MPYQDGERGKHSTWLHYYDQTVKLRVLEFIFTFFYFGITGSLYGVSLHGLSVALCKEGSAAGVGVRAGRDVNKRKMYSL